MEMKLRVFAEVSRHSSDYSNSPIQPEELMRLKHAVRKNEKKNNILPISI